MNDASNYAVEQTAGSHSLAAAAHRGRSTTKEEAMAQFTRRSLLAGLSVAVLVPGQASRALAQQQDRVQRGDVKKFPSMIPSVDT